MEVQTRAPHDLQLLAQVRDELFRLHAEAREIGEHQVAGHPLSTQSAATRGHQSIFEQLAAMCAAVRARIKAENLTRK